MNKKFGAFSSSVNPDQLSKTVEGLLKMVGGLAVYFGYTSITGDINSLADQIASLITVGYSFVGLAETAFGLLRKIVANISERK